MDKVYLIFREITSRDGAKTQIVIGKALRDSRKAIKLAADMNKNQRIKEAAKIMDVSVRHYPMEVEIEEE